MEQQKFELRKVFFPNNWKEIISMTGHIFFQLFFVAIIAQINMFLFTQYSGHNDEFLSLIVKATLMFTTIQFIPSLVASGALVVGSNLVGQGRQAELGKVIKNGLLVNITISLIVIIIVESSAPQLLSLLDIDNTNIGNDVHGTYYNQIDFASSYFRLMVIQLFLMSIAQVYISGLQAIKKQKHIAIGAVVASVLDIIYVSVVLFVFKTQPLLAALGIPVAALFQMIYAYIIAHQLIDLKKYSFKESLDKRLISNIVKIGLPITMEIALWKFCNFSTNAAITNLDTGGDLSQADDLTKLYLIHATILTINEFATVFLQASGTVTSILVAKKIGMDDKEGAFQAGVDGWRIAIYGQLILSLIVLGAIYPLLVFVYGRDQALVLKYGMWMYSIVFIKCLFDTVNMTLLRSLWSVGDLWTPLIVSIFTMIIGMVALPWAINLIVKGNVGLGILLINVVVALDPISRSIIYVKRWFSKKWFKHVKQV
ncbi:MATE family efflux transporter [Spiroplasma endosymbiont of Othius punctulatus]|uniref:MATE family efflux transporter n=1 Tax=Spiroplasma endosymbiont of Othius punctulatus TaxID=3066289 RepID=UPI0030D5DFD4